MSLLRILASLRDGPQHCQWALVRDGRPPHPGAGSPSQLPQRVERVQLVVPAAEVLITRVRLPPAARRQSGAVLAFAVEEQILGDPDTHQVSWLGTAGGTDVLAVVDRTRLKLWQDALEAAGVRSFALHCEVLMLPLAPGEWSLAWDGEEGFVRTGEFEGVATDRADAGAPPLSLRMMLDNAKSRGEAPSAIAVYATAPGAFPEFESWQRALGVPLRHAGTWDWRSAPESAGISLAQPSAGWRIAPAVFLRLRHAVWIAGAALAIHALALAADWGRLAVQQRSLRQQMETSFREAFPDALAVVDPALQMRRKLAEARHAAGLPDAADFLPMIGKVAEAMQGASAGRPRVLSYESGRITLEIPALDDAASQRIISRLRAAGLRVERPRGGGAGGAVVLTMSAS